MGGGLAEHALPGRRVELRRRALEGEGIGAVRALQGAAMGELGEQAERRRGGHSRIAPRLARSCSSAATSVAIRVRSAS